MSQGLTVYSTLAMRMALDDGVLDGFTAETGIPLEVTFDPTTTLARRIEEGARPDLLIAVTDSLGPFVESGVLKASTVTPLIRTRIGLAVAKGAQRPDISSVDGFVRAMTEARSVAYSQAGASGIHLRHVLAELGILDAVNASATVLPKGFTATAIVDGRADLAVQQLSELAFVPDVDIVGPLPADVNSVTEFSVALGTGGASRPEAQALLRHLLSEAARTAYERSGLEAPYAP